jgi:hypothetical protein
MSGISSTTIMGFRRSYWALRERFVGLLEWLADFEAARNLAGSLRIDHA